MVGILEAIDIEKVMQMEDVTFNPHSIDKFVQQINVKFQGTIVASVCSQITAKLDPILAQIESHHSNSEAWLIPINKQRSLSFQGLPLPLPPPTDHTNTTPRTPNQKTPLSCFYFFYFFF